MSSVARSSRKPRLAWLSASAPRLFRNGIMRQPRRVPEAAPRRPGPLDSAGKRKTRRRCRSRGIARACSPRRVMGLNCGRRFCHANAATCQNSWEIPQIRDDLRTCGLPVTPRSFLQNRHIRALSALDRTQEVAGSSPASSTPLRTQRGRHARRRPRVASRARRGVPHLGCAREAVSVRVIQPPIGPQEDNACCSAGPPPTEGKP